MHHSLQLPCRHIMPRTYAHRRHRWAAPRIRESPALKCPRSFLFNVIENSRFLQRTSLERGSPASLSKCAPGRYSQWHAGQCAARARPKRHRTAASTGRPSRMRARKALPRRRRGICTASRSPSPARTAALRCNAAVACRDGLSCNRSCCAATGCAPGQAALRSTAVRATYTARLRSTVLRCARGRAALV
jgi:hypothetical protein